MTSFQTKLQKFGNQGEKTGWTYILIPGKIAQSIKPGTKKSFRIKGKIDDHPLKSVALIPMGDGDFIMPVNGTIRKAIRKVHGAEVSIKMEEDKARPKLSTALLTCLADEPLAEKFFNGLPLSHKHYYSNWIEAAKTEQTKTKRLAAVLIAFEQKLTFAQMLHHYRDKKA